MGILEDLKMQYRIGGVVQKLLFWNIGLSVVLFVLQAFVPSAYEAVIAWTGLSSHLSVVLTRPWTLLTYAFVHAGIFHLIFNLIVLNFVGRLFLTYFTQKQLLAVYFFGAIFAGLLYVVSSFVFNTGIYLVGASGAIMACLVALATYAPYMQVRLLLIGQVKMWHIAVGLLLLDLIQIPVNNTGGHLAHMAGALFGFIYIHALKNGWDLAALFGAWKKKPKAKNKTKLKAVHVNRNAKTASNTMGKTKDINQQKIDDILDKISKSGYESLTKEEKEFLFKVGKE